MSNPTKCPDCGRPLATTEITWPGNRGHDICQDCWETECSIAWWEAAAAAEQATEMLAAAGPIRMRCISIWQPWASLMACGAKILETRGWDTKVRGPIAIHASANKSVVRTYAKSPYRDQPEIHAMTEALGIPSERWEAELPFGALIGTGELIGTMKTESAAQIYPTQRPFGDFTPGRFAHRYINLTKLAPLPIRGRQGFFFTDINRALP